MSAHKNILVTRPSMPPFEEYVREIGDVWDNRWLTNMGPKHEQLQEGLRRYLDVQRVELLTNGHMALELSLQALKLQGEVITTPFTFASTTHAIVRNGLTPVFCDVSARDFTMDVSKVESLVTTRTSAIMPVHVYGNICDVDAIAEIAERHHLRVIYDAAHAFGMRYRNQGIASFGDVSCLSFHATKVFNTIEGGAACYRDMDFGLELYRLKNFGIRGPEWVDGVGTNAKMNEFCAAMGLCNLRHVDDEIARRGRVVSRYRERLEGVGGIRLSPVDPQVRPNYAYFPIIVDEQEFGASRDGVCQVLEQAGVKARKYFYPLTSAFECYRDRFDATQTPVALRLSECVLTLPLYADLPLEDVDFICDLVLDARTAGGTYR
ncbi:dTDP-4-amino-4,6-dideoxygalactose transaminase [Olsenella profusa DSM 13989]|uniref:DegT/DnrJ/EryC1/StrS family aminotransferase n=1 Tax=Olsenella profusa TaxID=138595 RepID=UPI0027893B18|nr:DegT/DnrJ/EryC1/StrS family aminotransferase [Olsenella profusa]MDP9858719.1 dTDP-4-amino-4,6-dideoxygalactose transaminase [Olsenella profusa DSM 13989]